MKKLKFYILFLTFILSFSCKDKTKSEINKTVDLDSIKTIELITQILKDEKDNYLAANYITEKPIAISTPKVRSFKNYITKNLCIKDSIHYKSQIELYKNFKVTKEIVSNKKILTEIQFEEFEKKSKKGEFNFWKWLNENTNEGFCSIAKPIFNETYDLAYVQIGFICGSLCGENETRIYEYKKGKWVKTKIIRGSIS